VKQAMPVVLRSTVETMPVLLRSMVKPRSKPKIPSSS